MNSPDLLTLFTNPYFLTRLLITQAVGFTLTALILQPSVTALARVLVAVAAHATDWGRLYYYVRGDFSTFWLQYWRGMSYAEGRKIYWQRQQRIRQTPLSEKRPTPPPAPEEPDLTTLEGRLEARAVLAAQAQSLGLAYEELMVLLKQSGADEVRRVVFQAADDLGRMQRAYHLGIGTRMQKLIHANERIQADELLLRAAKTMEEAERLGVADTVRSFLATGHDDTADKVITEAQVCHKRAEQIERLGERIRALTLADRSALLKRLEEVANTKRKRDFTRALYALEKEVAGLEGTR